ncbi:MAG: monomeric [FeFe] hydrogenase [Alphaproteobacteria bacterium]
MLTSKNIAKKLRTELLVKVAKSFVKDNLASVNEIPLELHPNDATPLRSSLEKDREVARLQTLGCLGYVPEDVNGEDVNLEKFAKKALERKEKSPSKLAVIPAACNACPAAKHKVTNACQGCVARPCVVNCPKKAISFVDGKAFIDKDLCINCGICAGLCPYQAILKTKLPCEDACPVDAISKDENGIEHIDVDACISCGKCLNSCPFSAVIETSEMIDVMNYIKNTDKKVVAMLAPAFVGQYGVDIKRVIGALKKIGFNDVVEVAVGADITAKKEAAEFLEKMEEGEKFMTTSCCPAYYKAAHKHIPELAPFVSHTKTPMYYTAEIVKQENPDCVSVFVGPCLAKRVEADTDPNVDYVLTFEEIYAMFEAGEINFNEVDEADFAESSCQQGRLFPLTGGVAGAVASLVKDKAEIKAEKIDGLSKDTIKLLKRYATKGCDCNMIEVMCCEGGCISGPGCIEIPKKATRVVETYAAKGEDLSEK